MNKKFTVWTTLWTIQLCILFLLAWPGPGISKTNEIQVRESDPSRLIVAASFPDYHWQPAEEMAGDYLLLTASGCGHTWKTGHPMLPTAGFLVGVPPRGQPTLSVLEEQWETVDTPPLSPVPSPSGEPGPQGQPLGWDLQAESSIYSQDVFYPSNLTTIELLGHFRDQRIARVQLFPFRYNPVRQQLQICRHLVLQIEFSSPDPANNRPSLLPVSRGAEQTLSRILLNYNQARAWRIHQGGESLDRPAKETDFSPRCRITVSEDGIYSIGHDELQEAGLGLRSIDPRTFQLTNKGSSVPIYVKGEKDGSFDQGDAIEFYGQANKGTFLAQHDDMYQDPYDSKNVYWLSWDMVNGTRLVEEDAGIQVSDARKPASYELTVHAEEDNYRDHLSKQDQRRDHWFWDTGISAQGMKIYPLELPHPDRGSPLRPRVRVMLHGLTSVEEYEPDHHVLVYLNDHLVADQMWDGQEKLLVDSSQEDLEITSSAVEEDENALTIICPGDTEAEAIDRVLLNWIEVDYPRLFWAADDCLEFSKPRGESPGMYQFTLGGFSETPVSIYKLGNSVITNAQGEWVEIQGQRSYQITFQDEVFDHQTRYVAVSAGAKKQVLSIDAQPASTLKDAGRGGDMVMVVHQDFLENIVPLAEFRRSQGVRVEVVSTAEIYDQFSHGLFTPAAIQDFLRYAYQSCDPTPLYVLLVGDGSWDYKNTLELGQNFVPPIMTQTSLWGETPCDNLYGCVSGDDQLPDLFVGRLPVRTNQDLDAVVNKIIAAESSPELGDWRRRLLFICGAGNHGSIFRSQSESLIREYVAPDFLISRVYAHSPDPGSDPYFGGTQDLIDALDEGVSFVNYIGHGGGGIWSDAGLMRLEDVERLRNGPRWPIVASLTCFTAAFDEPKRESLGERLLLAEDRGVAGFWGSSGLAWLYSDYNLNDQLMKTIFSGGRHIFGQSMTEAKLQFMSIYGGQIAQDLVNEYNLFGDPLSRIGFPLHTVDISLQPEAVNPGELLNIQGAAEEAAGGQVTVTITDEGGTSLWESTLPFEGGRFQTSLQVPAEAAPGKGTVKCYYWDPQRHTDGAGKAHFALGRAFFDSIYTMPPQPAATDTVHVWASVSAAQGIDSAWCQWKVGALDSLAGMVPQTTPGLYRTADPIPALARGTTIRFWVTVADSMGLSTTSSQQTYRIPAAPDLLLSSGDVSLAAQEGVGISVVVSNYGETQADSVLVRMTMIPPPGQRITREGLIETIPPASRDSLFIPWDLPAGTYDIAISVDPLNAIDESNEDNNEATALIPVELFDITPEEGTVVQGQHAVVFSLDGNLSCEIPSGAVGRHQVLNIRAMPPFIQTQPDLFPARLATGTARAYQMSLFDSTASLEGSAEIHLTFKLDGQDSLNLSHADRIALYRWNPTIGRWIRHRGVSWISPDSVSASISGLGVFSPMINGDQDPPSIEITVEDQHFSEGALVSHNAKIVALIQDANGVDSQEHPIAVQHNGLAVGSEEINYTPSLQKNGLPVSYSPRFAKGRHSISFSAFDCNGNFSAKTINFEVIDSHGIDQMGNYPNPVEEETAFVYRLTGPSHAEEISLKIYTVAGRLIRSFHDFIDDFGRPGTQLDHHVLTWDGRDEDGYSLANGVYFYKIRAKWEDQTAEETGKLAILR